MSSFVLQYGGPGLFRKVAHLEWVAPTLPARAKALGWSGNESLFYLDSDGVSLGGFVPTERSA